jgi:hypothetical protein
LVVGVLAFENDEDKDALVQTTSPSAPTTAPTTAPPSTVPTTEGDLGPGMTSPPKVVVHGTGDPIELQAWTFCFANLCADGLPPDDPPDVGLASEVTVEFPIEDWNFEATFNAPGEECGRSFPGTLSREGPTTFRLAPYGPAGTYDVTLSGRGGAGASQGGDLFVTFRWTTPTDGPSPDPSAIASIVADHDGQVDSYGVEVALLQLAGTPADATASVVVTAANGQSVTLEPPRFPSGECPVGRVSFAGPPALGLQAAAIGPPPFTYDVTVVLDSVTYRATATWPDDVDEECSPCVPLEFDPPLPSLND